MKILSKLFRKILVCGYYYYIALLSSCKTIKKKPAIDAVTATINTTVEEMREQMYQNGAQPDAQHGADAQARKQAQGGTQASEDIQDADFEEVK